MIMGKKKQSPSKRLAVFDGFKGILILLIIFYYFFQHMLPGGFLAVNFFLLLAGFFAFRYFYVADVEGKSINLFAYYKKRIERIFFPMLAMMITTVSYIVLFDQRFFVNLRNMAASSLIFLNNYYQIFNNQSYFVQSANPSPFTHLWYISLYVQLILLTPILMFLFYSWHKKIKIATNMLLIATLMSAVALGWFYRPDADPSGIYYNIFTRGFAFTLGGALGLLFPVHLRPRPMQAQMKRILNGAGLLCVVLTFFMLRFMYGTQPFAYRFGMSLYTIVSLVLLLTAIHPDTLWNKVFSFPLFTFFGKRSLSYYLWFYPVHLLLPAKLATLTGQNIWLSVAIQFVVIMLLSEVTYQVFEQQRWSLPLGQDFNLRKTHLQLKYLGAHKGVLRGVKTATILYAVLFAIGVVGIALSPESRNNVADDVQKVIEENKKIAEQTRNESSQEVKVINNIEGLSREELLHANALEVTFIGDSILAATAGELNKVFPKGVIDAVEGRHLYQSNATAAALTVANQLKPTVVSVLATNSTFTAGQLNDYIEAVGTDKEHFFITSAAKRDWVYDANYQIHQAAQRYGNVKVIDWATYANDHLDWFYEDGIHPNQLGAEEFAKYIAQQIYLQR